MGKEEMGMLPPAPPAEEPRALEAANLNVLDPIREDERESIPIEVTAPVRAYAVR